MYHTASRCSDDARNGNQLKRVRHVILFGALVNIILAAIKILVGWLGHSQALLADGLHSCSDLLSDALVLIATHYARQEADHDHPYGHARIETAATVILAFILALAGAAIAGSAIWRWYSGHMVQPHVYVIWIAVFSVLLKEIIFHWTHAVARRVKSELLRANAWHHRSDAGASMVVLIGVASTYLGFPYGDYLAAIIVGALIIKMSWHLGWSSLCELVDTGVDLETQDKITATIVNIPGVQSIHQLRTRSMGGAIFVDVHVLVKPHISVSEGHFIGQQVHRRLQQDIPDIVDVTTHIDPEEDDLAVLNDTLPTRAELLPQLIARWQALPGSATICKVQLHYLAGRIYVELHLSLEEAIGHEHAQALEKRYQEAVQDLVQLSLVFIPRRSKITATELTRNPS